MVETVPRRPGGVIGNDPDPPLVVGSGQHAAQAVARAVGDRRAAFAAYEDVMRPYIAQAQELPPGGVNGFVPKTRLETALRVHATRWPLRNLMTAQFAKSDAIELPDYGASFPTNGAFVG
jgi:hypothetical protein